MAEVIEGVDYCTMWPDQIGSLDLRACCAAHDDFYAQQTSLDLLAYLGAHWDLAACVASVSWTMAATMFAGLVTLGLPYLIHRHNRRQPGSGRER